MSKQLENQVRDTIKYWLMRADRNIGKRTTIKVQTLLSLLESFELYSNYHKGYEC